jgi:nucleotide-binding universal stress UspA family protein
VISLGLVSPQAGKGISAATPQTHGRETVGENPMEWGWSDSPIVLPLAFSPREWNAVYVAAHVAECCGAPLIIFHVKPRGETVDAAFKATVDGLIATLKIRAEYALAEVEGDPSFQAVAELIVNEAARRQAQAVIMAANKESFLVKMVGRVSDRVSRMNKGMTILVETPRPETRIADHPAKVLVLVKEKTKPGDAFILAAALTSLATTKDAELIAAQVMLLPPTVPLEAVEFSDTLKEVEREFAYSVGDSIRSLGRIFTPRILVARQLGKDIAGFATSERVDLMILTGNKERDISSLFGRDTTDIVRNSPCVVLVVFSRQA